MACLCAFWINGKGETSWVVKLGLSDLDNAKRLRLECGDELMHVLRNAGVAPTDAVGNVLLIQSDSPDDRSPAVIAYNAAELLATEFPEVVVQSRLDLPTTLDHLKAIPKPRRSRRKRKRRRNCSREKT